MQNTEHYDLSPLLHVWKRYDPPVKAELWSSAISDGSATFLIDPIDDAITTATAIIVTNENHLRDAPQIAGRLMIPIFSHSAIAGPGAAHSTGRGKSIGGILSVIEIEGAAAGEIALLDARDGGTLVVGDALINFEPHGLALLPPKYCENQSAMRRSLRQLLDLRFQRLLFAHGTPILQNAHERLQTILDS